MINRRQEVQGAICNLLRTGDDDHHEPGLGLEALLADSSTRQGLSAEVLADLAGHGLETLRFEPPITYETITAHVDDGGQLVTIEVEYVDHADNPTSQTVVVDYLDQSRATTAGDGASRLAALPKSTA